MNFARKLAVGALASLLTTLLFLVAIDYGIIHIAGNPANIKRFINDTGVYNNVITNALDQAQQSAGASGITLTDPAVKAAAASAFTPQMLQTDTNQIIDSVYAWLNGKTPTPDFKIDLSGAKANFANAVSQAAEQRAASLPRCTSLPSGTSIDPFSATCLPPGVTPAQVAAEAKQTALSNNDFIGDPVITPDSLKKSGTNQNVFTTTYQNAPKRYQQAKKTPYILGLLAILDAIAIVLLSSSRLAGLRRVGITLLIAGIVLLLFIWALIWGVNQKLLPRLSASNAVIQADARALVQDITKSINSNFRTFGIAYVVLGTAAAATPFFINRRGRPVPVVETKNDTAAEPAAKPKPTKKVDI